ncbi:DUF3793 family protein [Stomatobaculum longum]|uniref:DUF3793 family protein n=1 Tax=Stomatobaculum longum TaxID=796942 RepID=UPI0028E460DF|nr:DUF3793 family protein [Stomatobaculum longum]
MSDAFLVEHCAPTFAGLKTGNLFRISYADIEVFREELRELNGILKRKGLRAVPVRMTAEFALVYLYRPDFLKRDLGCEEAARLLTSLGYEPQSVNRSVAFLARMMREKEVFPHEVGLFLGYPPEDVLGFMKSSREGVKCVGCWKVYGDETKARAAFWRFQRCREVFEENVQRGRKLEALIVRCPAKKQENHKTSGGEKIA